MAKPKTPKLLPFVARFSAKETTFLRRIATVEIVAMNTIVRRAVQKLMKDGKS